MSNRESVAGDALREAMAHWPAGVAIVAFRHDDRVVATTVSALMSLSLEPPLVLVALGPNATVRPFLDDQAPFGISLLRRSQQRLATIYADPFPVGPDPFTPGPAPLVADALVALHCTVTDVLTGGDHAIVIAAVQHVRFGGGEDPLVRFGRRYHGLGP